MSPDEVACIRRLFEAVNAGDVEAALAELHPDVELLPMRAQLEGKVYRGHDGYRNFIEHLDEDWSSLQTDIEEWVDGTDAIVVLARLRVRGAASGVDVDVPMGWVWRFRDGKVVYGKAYSERADALRAAGLEASTEATA